MYGTSSITKGSKIMGLDMYLRGDKFVSQWDHSQQKPEGGSLEVKRPVVDGFDVETYVLDMGTWRKFAPLHVYIVNEFADGVDECHDGKNKCN